MTVREYVRAYPAVSIAEAAVCVAFLSMMTYGLARHELVWYLLGFVGLVLVGPLVAEVIHLS